MSTDLGGNAQNHYSDSPLKNNMLKLSCHQRQGFLRRVVPDTIVLTPLLVLDRSLLRSLVLFFFNKSLRVESLVQGNW